MKTKRAILLAVLVMISSSVVAQFQISVLPQASFPVLESSQLFGIGYGADVGVQFLPPALAPIGLGIRASALYSPLFTTGSVFLGGVSAGVQALIPFTSQFFASADFTIGYHYEIPIGWESAVSSGSGLLLQSRVGVGMRLTPFTDLVVGGGLDYAAGLQITARGFAGINLRVTSPQSFGGTQVDPNTPIILFESDRGVTSTDLSIEPLFPALYAQYDKRPLGSITLLNNEESPAEDVRVSVFVEEVMTNPFVTTLEESLGAGNSEAVALNALFTDEVLGFSEGKKISGQIRIEYRQDGQLFAREFTPVFEFLNRNALVWDDDYRICSFVTSKDPVVFSIARKASTLVGRESGAAVDENFRKAMLLFTILSGRDLAYQVDPVTPYEEYFDDPRAVDFLQFPRQTLQFGNGDCDDLSALYAALLEAAGIRTAFVTHPGHIYIAFELGRSIREREGVFSNVDELIIDGDSAWVPVEVTLLEEDFLRAWKTGASQWRRYSSTGDTGLFDTRSGWDTYQPVGFFDDADTQSGGLDPEVGEVDDRDYAAYRDLLDTYINQEIFPRVASLEERIANSRQPYRLQNRLGVLYGQFGLTDDAESAFGDSIRSRMNAPALVNLGNLEFLRENWMQAQEYYEQASGLEPQNALVLLSLARINHELENYGTTQRNLEQLAAIDSDLAETFPYLQMTGEDAARAADAQGARKLVLWSTDDEEE